MSRTGLGARLAGWTTLATAVAVLAFATTATILLWLRERDERRHPVGDDDLDGAVDESAADEAMDQLVLSLAVTAPVVVILAAGVSRRLARRVTDRIEGVVGAATRMSHDQLGERLPVSPAGDELDQLAVALNGLFERLERGLAAQTRFVADASHELRTPLAVLQSDLEIARRRERPAAEWEAVADRARDEVTRMTAIIEALLRLARPDGAQASARIELRALADDVAARARPAADAAGVTIAVAGDAAPIVGDADALAVAIGNLVANAITHSPRGGQITVAVSAGTITVSDEGPGVPVADRERIFLPFARGSLAADRARPGGVGLGLSVARRIVESHRGTLTLDPDGPGARFVARIPPASS